MGKNVNITLPTGRVVSVPEEAANEGTFRRETAEEAQARADSSVRAEENSGAVNWFRTVAEGAVDTATGGLYGKGVEYIAGEESTRNYRNRAKENAGGRFIGEIGSLVTGVGAAKIAAGAGKAVAERAIGGAVRPLTKGAETLAKVAGRGTEGAVLGGVGYVTGSNVTGDPLTVSGLVAEMTLGGIIDVGVGKLGDTFFNAGTKAKRAVAAGKDAAAVREAAERGRTLLKEQGEGYTAFKAAHDEFAKATNRANGKAQGEAKAYDAAQNPGAIQKAVRDLEKNRLTLQAEAQATPFGRAQAKAKRDFEKAQREYEATSEVVTRIASNPNEWGKTVSTVGEFLDDVEKPLARGAKEADKAAKPYRDLAAGGNAWAKSTGEVSNFLKNIENRYVRAPEVAAGKKAAKTTDPAQVRDQFVNAIADASQSATKFGDRKVFISSLYESMDPAFRPASLDEFKQVLLAAHKKGDIVLSRADMVAAMDPALVKASEFSGGGGDWHFVTIPERKAAVETAGEEGAHAARVKEFNTRLNAIMKRQAGRTGNAGRWEGAVDPDVAGAIDDLRVLTEDIRKAYPNAGRTGTKSKILELPEIPRAPGAATPEELAKIADYRKRLADLTTRAGKGSADPDSLAALAELKKLTEEVRSTFPGGGKKLPELPDAPTAPQYAPPFGDASPGNVAVPAEDADNLTRLAAVTKDHAATIDLVKRLNREGKYAEAIDEIEALKIRAAEAGYADLPFPKFPKKPGPVTPIDKVDLPKNLDGFARMTADKVERLAAAVDQMPGEVGESFMKMADDLGLARQGTVGDTVRAVWGELRQYPGAMAKAAAMETAEQVKNARGLFGKGMEFAKKGVKYGVARELDSGGVRGALLRNLAGPAVGYALDGTEGAILGGMIVGGKLRMRERINRIVARIGQPTGRALTRLAPISSYLKGRFGSDEVDTEEDTRVLAKNRADDVYRMAMTAPDAAYSALEPLMGHPSDIAFKMHQQVVAGTQYLANTAPKDPGLDTTLRGSNWRPSTEQAVAFAHRIEAVADPLTAIERSIQGDAHPATIEALWTVWSPIMEELAGEFMRSPKGLSYEAEARMARLFRVQTGLQQPAVLASLQGLYLPAPQGPGQGSPNQTGGKPSGRPATVQSPVAGSSVSNLTR